MRKRQYTDTVTFFMSEEMYLLVKRISDEKEIGLSELLRSAVQDFITRTAITERDQPALQRLSQIEKEEEVS